MLKNKKKKSKYLICCLGGFRAEPEVGLQNFLLLMLLLWLVVPKCISHLLLKIVLFILFKKYMQERLEKERFILTHGFTILVHGPMLC